MLHRRTVENDQLTLDVGGAEEPEYVKSAFKISGSHEDFVNAVDRDEELTVTVTGPDGEVLFRSAAWVEGVQIKTLPPTTNRPQLGALRTHTIKLGTRPALSFED